MFCCFPRSIPRSVIIQRTLPPVVGSNEPVLPNYLKSYHEFRSPSMRPNGLPRGHRAGRPRPEADLRRREPRHLEAQQSHQGLPRNRRVPRRTRRLGRLSLPCLVTQEPAGQPTSGGASNGADRSRSEAGRAQRRRPRDEASGRGRSDTPLSPPKHATSS